MKKAVKPLTKEEIFQTLRKHQEILSRYKVRKIGLFGSFAKNKQSKKSDIDFFVDFEEPSFDNFIGLLSFLERLFRRKVEILTSTGVETIRINYIKEEIKRSIIYV